MLALLGSSQESDAGSLPGPVKVLAVFWLRPLS
jgi:hypothetical protein